MPLYRRPGSPHWWYAFQLAGRRFRGSTRSPSRPTAELIEAAARNRALLDSATGRKPEMTLDVAFGRYWSEHAHALPSARDLGARLKRWKVELGGETALSALGDDAIATACARRRARVGPASVNRDLAYFRAVLRMAAQRWGVSVATINWRAHLRREPAPRERVLSPAEAERLIEAAAPHLKPAIVLSLCTGIRLGNCIRLDWAEVNLAGRELRLRVKSARPGGKPSVVPLAEPALLALANLGPRERGPVFTWRPNISERRRAGRAASSLPRPIVSWRTAWKAALRRAGIADFRWHDLRHTAASWMVARGVPINVVKEILGHASIATTMRYAHLQGDAKRAAVEALAAHFRHSGPVEKTEVAEKKA